MRNIDGINKTKYIHKVSAPAVKVKHTVSVDAVAIAKRKTRPKGEVFYTGFLVPPEQYIVQAAKPGKLRKQLYAVYEAVKIKFDLVVAELKRFNSLKKAVPVYAIIVALALSFGGGAWAALNTQTTEAESVEQTQAGSVPMQSTGSLGPISSVSNDVLYNMTIGQLENYLNAVAEQNKQLKDAERMALRKEKLRAYLTSKKTPFVEATDVIAEQKHWKLILAISFAESTFGRNCVDNNCSNIGVKPGHAYWRKYATLGDWVKDFNRLMERRYSNWTLEQMNGVYVQPKNPNWLAATRQVLEELQELGIE